MYWLCVGGWLRWLHYYYHYHPACIDSVAYLQPHRSGNKETGSVILFLINYYFIIFLVNEIYKTFSHFFFDKPRKKCCYLVKFPLSALRAREFPELMWVCGCLKWCHQGHTPQVPTASVAALMTMSGSRSEAVAAAADDEVEVVRHEIIFSLVVNFRWKLLSTKI